MADILPVPGLERLPGFSRPPWLLHVIAQLVVGDPVIGDSKHAKLPIQAWARKVMHPICCRETDREGRLSSSPIKNSPADPSTSTLGGGRWGRGCAKARLGRAIRLFDLSGHLWGQRRPASQRELTEKCTSFSDPWSRTFSKCGQAPDARPTPTFSQAVVAGLVAVGIRPEWQLASS